MISAIEYGENIGTLKNLFGDLQQPVMFAERIIGSSNNKYLRVGPYQWYSQEKREYIKIIDE